MKQFLICVVIIALASLGSPAQAAGYTVHIRDFKYAPAPLRIHAGDTVTFINDDGEAHTVTAKNKSFDSAGMDSGDRWQHMFMRPGIYPYFCQLHPYMKATIIVLPAKK